MRFAGLMLCIPILLLCLSCESTHFDCNKLCNKDLECQEIEENELQGCKDQCETLVENDYVNTVFLDAMDECLNKETCEEFNDCRRTAFDKCLTPPDTKKLVETLHNKGTECNVPTEELKYNEDEIKCFTQKFVDDLEGCISKVACATFMDDLIKCWQKMGLQD